MLNAAGVHQVPMVISIWDDKYGISVENKDQTIKDVLLKPERASEISSFIV